MALEPQPNRKWSAILIILEITYYLSYGGQLCMWLVWCQLWLSYVSNNVCKYAVIMHAGCEAEFTGVEAVDYVNCDFFLEGRAERDARKWGKMGNCNCAAVLTFMRMGLHKTCTYIHVHVHVCTRCYSFSSQRCSLIPRPFLLSWICKLWPGRSRNEATMLKVVGSSPTQGSDFFIFHVHLCLLKRNLMNTMYFVNYSFLRCM